MNTLSEQEPSPEIHPDFHWHRCEHCGATFSHRKATLRRLGCAMAAHCCPRCGLFVNSKETGPAPRPVDFPNWLGKGVQDGQSPRRRGK